MYAYKTLLNCTERFLVFSIMSLVYGFNILKMSEISFISIIIICLKLNLELRIICFFSKVFTVSIIIQSVLKFYLPYVTMYSDFL